MQQKTVFKVPSIFRSIRPKDDDEKYMLEAIKEAEKAYSVGETPVGAVLVSNNFVIARGHNQVEMLNDATAHAEILCITAGSAHYHNWRLSDATLYSTLEPCMMCAGAMILSRISRLVWGTRDIRHGANGSYMDVFSQKHPIHEMEIESRVLEKESSFLLKEFFKDLREKNGR